MNNLINYIKNNREQIFVVFIIMFFLINSFIFYNVFATLLYDHGREFLVPSAIVDGKALYKDILNIYGPLGFYINALLFKIFGKSFTVLYFSGCIFASIFLFGFYKSTKELLDHKFAFAFTIFVIGTCIFNPSIFSYVTPYSYSLLYSLAAFSISFWAIIKLYKTNKTKYAYWASLFSGFCISCKFEYFLLPFIVLFVLLFVRKQKLINLLTCICLFLLFPLISLSTLFLQGLNINDIIGAYLFIKKAALSESMIWFHKHIGMYPSLRNIVFSIVNTTIFFVELYILKAIYNMSIKYNEKFGATLLFIFAFILFYYHFSFKRFSFFPLFLLIILIIKGKYLFYKHRIAILVLVLTLISTIKTFWCLHIITGYGAYTIPFVIVSMVYLLKVLAKKEYYYLKKFFIVVILAMGMVHSFYAIRHRFKYCTEKIPLPYSHEYIYTTKIQAEPIFLLMEWLKNNTDKNDTILVYPEGPIVNILSDRPTDYRFYSLHSIFMDAFGEDYVINKIKGDKIKYIIYAKGTSVFVFKNNNNYYPNFEKFLDNYYKKVANLPEATTKDENSYTVYELNNK